MPQASPSVEAGGDGKKGAGMSKVPRQASTYEHLVCGTCAGVVTTVSLHPLDLVKTRFQVHEGAIGRTHGMKARYRSTFHAFRSIVSKEGVRAVYQGLGPATFGSGTSWGLYFFFYESAKKQNKWMLETNNFWSNKTFVNLCSSTQAGVTTVFCTNPIWLVKTRMQLQVLTDPSLPRTDPVNRVGADGRPLYRNMMHAFQSIVKEEGAFALYRGLVPALLLVSHGVLQFVAYEELKSWRTNDGDRALNGWEPLLMGASSKIFASTTTYPWQVMKARIQQRQSLKSKPYNSVIDCARRIFKSEGIRGFYKGLAPNCMRIAPSAAITFWTYENLKSVIVQRN